MKKAEKPREELLAEIAELKQRLAAYEQNILNREQEYLEIIDSSSEGSFIHDLKKGEIYYSDEWKRRLGIEVSPKEALQASMKRVHPDDLAGVYEAYQRACENKDPKVKMEFRAETVDAGYIWILGQAKITYNQEGKPIKYFGTHMDITDQKRVEEELRDAVHLIEQQNRKLNAVIESLPHGLVIYDKNANPIFYNEQAAKSYSKALEDKNIPAADRVEAMRPMHKDGGSAATEEMPMMRVLKGEVVRDLEMSYIVKSGERVWVSSTTAPIIDSDGEITGAVATYIDITERKKMEEALRENEARLEELVKERTRELSEANQQIGDILESISDCFVAFDENLLYTYVNKATADLMGCLPEEMIGRPLQELIPETNRIALKNYYQVLREKKPKFFEVFTEHLQIWTEIKVYPYNGGISIYFRDVTERKRAEEALLQSEERFSKAFNTSAVMMAIQTLDNSRYLDVNDCWLNTLGYTREEVIGHNGIDLNLWVEFDRMASLFKVLENNKSVRNYELKLRTKNGEIISGLCSTDLISINGNNCILSTMVDLTDQKKIEKEISRLDRLNLVGEMAASIGHEIRNPMTTIRGFLQMLSQKDESGKNREYYDLMIDELDRANSIITEYLSVANNKSVNLKPIFLNKIITTVYPMIESDGAYSDKQVKLDLGLPPELVADENEIRQLLLNLGRNGLEAMGSGGVLTIRTRGNNGEAVLEVEDQGTGIPSDILDNLGTPFQTTKENGTGLGLAVCYSIAHRHNAKIEVDTGAGGTTFRVRFGLPQ